MASRGRPWKAYGRRWKAVEGVHSSLLGKHRSERVVALPRHLIRAVRSVEGPVRKERPVAGSPRAHLAEHRSREQVVLVHAAVLIRREGHPRALRLWVEQADGSGPRVLPQVVWQRALVWHEVCRRRLERDVQHTRRGRRAVKVAEREALACIRAGAERFRIGKRRVAGIDPVVAGAQVAIAREVLPRLVEVGRLGVRVPLVASHVRWAGAAGDRRRPIVVRVVEVAERRLEAAAVRRMRSGGHAGVPLAREERLVTSLAHERAPAGHRRRNARVARHRILIIDVGRHEVVDVNVDGVAAAQQR